MNADKKNKGKEKDRPSETDLENLKSPEELAKEAEVTEEDLEALGPEDLSMDMGEDEQLKQRVDEVDFEGKDLDIPGRSMDDDLEDIGAEDEENNHYSLGSESNEELEGSNEDLEGEDI